MCVDGWPRQGGGGSLAGARNATRWVGGLGRVLSLCLLHALRCLCYRLKSWVCRDRALVSLGLSYPLAVLLPPVVSPHPSSSCPSLWGYRTGASAGLRPVYVPPHECEVPKGRSYPFRRASRTAELPAGTPPLRPRPRCVGPGAATADSAMTPWRPPVQPSEMGEVGQPRKL